MAVVVCGFVLIYVVTCYKHFYVAHWGCCQFAAKRQKTPENARKCHKTPENASKCRKYHELLWRVPQRTKHEG